MPGCYVNSWNTGAGGVFQAVSTVVGCGNRRVQVYITPVMRLFAVPLSTGRCESAGFVAVSCCRSGRFVGLHNTYYTKLGRFT